MHGNIQEAMVEAVEQAKLVCVFLSREYLESKNCQLEFRRAVILNKPIMFISTTDHFQPVSWLRESGPTLLSLWDKRIQVQYDRTVDVNEIQVQELGQLIANIMLKRIQCIRI